MGADIALVVGEVGDEVKGSLRAHQRFYSGDEDTRGHRHRRGHLQGRGYGGGHPTAASFTLNSGDEARTISDFLALIGELLKEKPVEIT